MMISYTRKNVKYQYVKYYVKIYSNILPIWMIYQKFRVSCASGGESEPLNSTSRTLLEKPGVHIAYTVLLQKESENQSFFPIEKHLNHNFRILPAKFSCCGFLIYLSSIYHLSLNLTSLADKNLFAKISGVQAHVESNDFNIFFQRCCYIQSWRSLKIQDLSIRYCLKMIQEQVSSSNPEIFWASLPPSLGFTGSDFLGKSLWTENDGGTKE